MLLDASEAEDAHAAHPSTYVCGGARCSSSLDTVPWVLGTCRADTPAVLPVPPPAGRRSPLGSEVLDVAAEAAGSGGIRLCGLSQVTSWKNVGEKCRKGK